MNAKKVIALSVLALSAGAAFAGGEADFGVNYSNTTSEPRAIVKAETQQAARSGQLQAAGERDFGVVNVASGLSRAEVKSEFFAARAAGQTEPSGEQLAVAKPVQRHNLGLSNLAFAK